MGKLKTPYCKEFKNTSNKVQKQTKQKDAKDNDEI